MIRRSETTVINDGVTPQPGVYVTVKNDTGALATLYTDGGGLMANPFLSGLDGTFAYNIADGDAGAYTEEYRLTAGGTPRVVRAIYLSTYGVGSVPGPPGTNGINGINGGVGSSAGFSGLFAAANGMVIGAGITRAKLAGNTVPTIGSAEYIYDAAVNSTTVAANPRTQFLAADGRGFKLDPNQRLMPEMFGDTSTPTAASATLRAAFDYYPDSTTKCSPKMLLDNLETELLDTLEPSCVFSMEGSGTGYISGSSVLAPPSKLIGPKDKSALRVRGGGTDGLGLLPGALNASGSLIRGVTFDTSRTTGLGTDPNSHGIHARGTVKIEHCAITAIGDGINITAAFNGDAETLGNANNWLIYSTQIKFAGANGAAIGVFNGKRGAADVNAGLSLGLYVHDAARAGLLEESFYPNTHIALQINSSGNRGVWYAGRKYQLIVKTDTGTVPGTNADIWYALDAAAAVSTRFPLWDALTTYYCMLPVLSDQSVFITPYQENAQTRGHSPLGIVIGGNMAWTQSTARLERSSHGLTCNLGMGHSRTAYGEGVNHPAYPFIGDAEYTVLGRPGSAATAIHKRAALFSHLCADNGLNWEYENVVGGVERDIVSRTGGIGVGNPQFTISGTGTALMFGRTVAQVGVLTLHQHAIGTRTSATSARIHEGVGTAPTSNYHAQGEWSWNIANPTANGGILGWACTASGTPGTQTPLYIFGKMAAQADTAALTSATAVAAPTKAEYDALRADLVAVQAAQNALLAKLRTAGMLLP